MLMETDANGYVHGINAIMDVVLEKLNAIGECLRMRVLFSAHVKENDARILKSQF